MPNRKKKVVLPLVAAVALALLFWLAFRDGSTEPVPARTAVKTSQATADWRATEGGGA